MSLAGLGVAVSVREISAVAVGSSPDLEVGPTSAVGVLGCMGVGPWPSPAGVTVCPIVGVGDGEGVEVGEDPPHAAATMRHASTAKDESVVLIPHPGLLTGSAPPHSHRELGRELGLLQK